MGSFNIACNASGQVIAEGEKCWVIPLIQQSTFKPVQMMENDTEHILFGIANSTCHPDAFWQPMTGFVSGVYADYGYVEPDDTPVNRCVMVEFFFSMYRKTPIVFQGENSVHDVPFDLKAFIAEKAPSLQFFSELNWYSRVRDFENLSFDDLAAVWRYIWDVAEEHRLFGADPSGNIRPVQFGAIHHRTFDHMVALTSKHTNYLDESYKPADFLRRELEDLTQQVEEVLKDADLSADKKAGTTFYIRNQFSERLRMGLSGSFRLIYPFMEEISSLLGKHLDDGLPFDKFVEGMLPVLNNVYVLAAMDSLNLKFSPLVYAGQDYDNSIGQAYAKFVSAVSKDITKERKKRLRE